MTTGGGEWSSGAAGSDEDDLDDLVALARAASVEAGTLLTEQARPWSRRDLDVRSKSSATDAVTAMDLAAERAIAECIRGARPHDGFWGEEGTQPRGNQGTTSTTTWVVDPLDGTVNYMYGLPHWAVSIAAQRRGHTVVGVVHVPLMSETFVAVRGRGSVLYTAEECVDLGPLNRSVRLESALIATGFGYAADRRREQAAVVVDLMPSVRDIRRLGAAAIDLCHVAVGRVDGFYELGLQPWDLAAGALIVTEAGGRVEGLNRAAPGEPFGEGMVVAAGPGLFDALHDAVLPMVPPSATPNSPPLLPSEPTVP